MDEHVIFTAIAYIIVEKIVAWLFMDVSIVHTFSILQ